MELLNKDNHISINSCLKNICLIDDFIEPLKSIVNDDLFFNISLCINEAVNNSIKHGNNLLYDKKVHLNYKISGNKIDFTIVDEGNGFDALIVPNPTEKDRLLEPSGRGIHIIKSLSSKYQYLEDGKVLNLQFYINE
jgi:serine/threonine-protein kinase RsbW